MEKKRVSLIITEECYEVLSEIATDYGTSLSSSINILAKLYKKEKDMLKAFQNIGGLKDLIEQIKPLE